MIPLLAVAGYGTSALVAAAIAALHAGRVVVPRVAEWESPPDVWLHPELAELRDELEEAIREWGRLGHLWGHIAVGVGASPGIQILPRPLDRVRAIATAHVSADFEDDTEPAAPGDDHEVDAPEGLIRRATIYVDPLDLVGRDAARVLAHELGHCLGYLHCTARLRRAHHPERGVQVPKRGHLMNPDYDRGGWTTMGLEADALGDPQKRRRARRRR